MTARLRLILRARPVVRAADLPPLRVWVLSVFSPMIAKLAAPMCGFFGAAFRAAFGALFGQFKNLPRACARLGRGVFSCGFSRMRSLQSGCALRFFCVRAPAGAKNCAQEGSEKMRTLRMDFLHARNRRLETARARPVVRAAFTLVEIMLALAVSAFVMFGCAAMMFDMMRLTEYFERGGTFRSHVDGVEKFLRAAFMNSEIETGNLGLFESPLASNTAKTVWLVRDFEDKNVDKYHLAYGVGIEHPLYPSPLGFAGDKLCLLELLDGGLYIVWRFVQPEREGEEAAIYKMLLSPWVKKIGYIYNDNDRWKEEDEIKTMGYSDLMPKYIKIYFDRHGEKYERLISPNLYLDFQISQ